MTGPCFFPSPTGRFYVTAAKGYPDQVPSTMQGLLATATPGAVIELLARKGAWGFGAPLIYRPSGMPVMGCRAEAGAFRLEWVVGVRAAAHPRIAAQRVEGDPRQAD